MGKIKAIRAREVLNSRGTPTIETSLMTAEGISVVSSISSGDGAGVSEGLELRDTTSERFNGRGVGQAVSYINDLIGPKLTGASVENQFEIDVWLNSIDTSVKKTTIGVNSMLSISHAVAKAGAASAKVPLYRYFQTLYAKKAQLKEVQIDRIPSPIVTVINGGTHGAGSIAFQEFLIMPSTSLLFEQALELSWKVYFQTKETLTFRNAGVMLSPGGGYAPNLFSSGDVLEALREAIMRCKLHIGEDVYLAIDAAASNYYSGGHYRISDKPAPLKPHEYLDYLVELNKEYSVLMYEDPIQNEALDDWSSLNERVGEHTYLTGDDIVAGNLERLKKSIEQKAISGVVIKSGQNPTISHVLDIIVACKQAGLKIVIGQRLEETNDTLIADLAVGVQADFIKFGPPVGGERVAKYNRLLAISASLKH